MRLELAQRSSAAIERDVRAAPAPHHSTRPRVAIQIDTGEPILVHRVNEVLAASILSRGFALVPSGKGEERTLCAHVVFITIRGMTNQTERQDAIRQHVEGLIAALESGPNRSTQNEQTSLRPTIKSNTTLAALGKAMREQSPGASLPTTVPLAGSVVAIVAIDGAKVIRFATDEDVRELKTTPAALLAIGVSNLLAATKDQPELVSRANMNFAIYHVGDSYDAARLLVPELREKMSKSLGAPAAFAIPHRDILIAAPAHDADKVRMLRQFAAEDSASAAYPITREVFVFDDSGAIKVLE